MNTSNDEYKHNNTDKFRSADETRRAIPLRDNRIDSRDLFVGAREIIIIHGEETYRLRLTAQNKLILTK